MSTALVVYGTKSGCTRGIAERIGETLASAAVEVTIAPAEEQPDPSAFDAVIVGSGVRAGQWHGSVKQWIAAHADALKARPVALYTACLTMASNPEKADEVRAYTEPLVAEHALEPVAIGLFAGMYEPKTFSLPERLIMKAMKAPVGDFRDMEAVSAWTSETAGKLGFTAPTHPR